MKKLSITTVFLFTLYLAYAQAPTSSGIIEIIDFHSTHRCMTCNAIEKNTRDVLVRFFQEELNQGKLRFVLINIDDKANADVVKEFDAFGTSLFVRVTVDGKSERINLTEFAFMNVNKKDDTFQAGIVREIRKALQKLG
jgi:hypothetical protein